MQIRGRMLAPVLALILCACGSSESGMIVNVTNWPDQAAKLRLLLTFAGKPGTTSFIDVGTPHFSIVIPTGQAGPVVVEGMVQDRAGCYIAGNLITADFAGGQGEIQTVELSLSPYVQKACPVASPPVASGYGLRLWGDRSDNYWLPADHAILRWDGTVWVSMDLSPVFLRSVSGSGSGDVWAVGAAGSMGVALRWSGFTWDTFPASGAAYLNLVWANNNSDVWTVGNSSTPAGVIQHWNSSAWSTFPPQGSKVLQGVWGSSSRDVWAVGETAAPAGIILHWDGSAWATIPTPASQDLGFVWGSSSRDVWAVGSTSPTSAIILNWDGVQWSTIPSAGAHSLFSVWGSSSSDVWTVGQDSTPAGLILHWNGARWAPVPSPVASQELVGVWGSSSSDVWVVGNTKAFILTALHWDGSTWTTVF